MKSNEFQHELERKIDLYTCGRLNQDQIDALWVEMIENPDAYAYLKTTVALQKMVKSSSASVAISNSDSKSIPISKSRSPKNWKKYAAAAAIVVSAGVGGSYIIESNSALDRNAGFKPYDKLELIVYRSSGNTQQLNDVRLELQKAIDAALLGNTSEAMISLNNILESTDDKHIKAEAYLNIGILEYNGNDFNSAAMSLQNAATLSSDNILLYERIIWNLAHAQMALGDNINAKNTIQKVVALEGAHSRAAKSYLDFMK